MRIPPAQFPGERENIFRCHVVFRIVEVDLPDAAGVGRYPDMILILDHAARGFNPYHCLEGLEKLGAKALPNLHVDTSVACSPLAIQACLRYLGPERVLYGSDFYCSHIRGTNLPIGDGFMWLDEEAGIWADVLYGAQPVLVGLANLQAIKAAFHMSS